MYMHDSQGMPDNQITETDCCDVTKNFMDLTKTQKVPDILNALECLRLLVCLEDFIQQPEYAEPSTEENHWGNLIGDQGEMKWR